MVDFRFYLITDRKQCGGRPLVEVLTEACRAGVRAVQLREKDLSPVEVYRLALELKAALDPLGARLLINDRADVARAADAAGVHLTEVSLPADAARLCLPPGALVGVSTHDLDGALRAQDRGADFITFGPVFFTPSKAPYGPPVGLSQLEAVARRASLPVFALGGATPERVRDCLHAGAYGVAAISAVLAAPDVTQAVRAFEVELQIAKKNYSENNDATFGE